MQCFLAATVLCLAIPASWQAGGWLVQIRGTAGDVDVCVQRHDEGVDHCLSRLPHWLAKAQLPFPLIRLHSGPVSDGSTTTQPRPARAPGLGRQP